jgi:hypothetical protein
MKKGIVFIIAGAIIVLLATCKKDKNDDPDSSTNPGVSPTAGINNIDSFLIARSYDTSNMYWYKDSDSVLRSSGPSAHKRYFRVRFNKTAKNALTDQGKLPVGGSFPEGSLIVKELYDTTTGEMKLLAILFKDPLSNYSANGWLWAELKPDGGEYVTAKEKGVQCVSCHGTNSRDYARLFDLF